MAVCEKCHQAVKTGSGGICIRDGRKVYHVTCAPSGLLQKAAEEWDAIVSRGVEYFVGKYVDGESPEGAEPTLLLKRFTETGEKLKAEVRVRKSKRG